MTRAIQLGVVFCVVCFLMSCGGEKESEPEQTAQATQTANPKGRKKPDYFPKSNPIGQLNVRVVDSLKVLKKQHGITLDKYWRNQGGVLSNEFFEVWYPPGRVTVTHAMHAFNLLMPAMERFGEYFGDAPAEKMVIHSLGDNEEFKAKTGRDFWFYAEIEGDTLTMQPIWLFFTRGIDEIAIPHEYYQWALGKITDYGAPRWLEEGVASYLSKEGELLRGQIFEFPHRTEVMKPNKLDEILEHEETKEDSRIAYYQCYMMVKRLVDGQGDEALQAAVRHISLGQTVEEAFESAFGKPYDEVIEFATDYTMGSS